ncbi:MAG: glycosyltransferase family 9 protein [Flavobacteriales bacterium]|nr:glycosyltransferase family 9 protein [Flavobacteriales bacterium]
MQRILVIRFSSIGDIVLCSPVLRVLRKKFPEADIRFVTKKLFAELLEPNPNLNGVFFLDGSLKDLASEMKAFKPDVVVDLHHNLRTRILKTLIGGKWLAFNKLNVEKWLKVNLKVDRLPAIHIVERYLETLKPLGIEGDGKGLEFHISPSASPNSSKGGELHFGQAPPQPSLKGRNSELPEGFHGKYVALVIGAKFKTKQLPVAKLIELCNGLKRPIVLIGGKEDAAIANEVVAQSTGILHNACGMHSLSESAWLVKQSEVVITHDTGMMHIAVAFNKKIISVWGNTIPEFGMYPYLPESEPAYLSEVNGLDCRPCSKIGFDACPKGHFRCMNEQSVSNIIEQTNQLLLP